MHAELSRSVCTVLPGSCLLSQRIPTLDTAAAWPQFAVCLSSTCPQVSLTSLFKSSHFHVNSFHPYPIPPLPLSKKGANYIELLLLVPTESPSPERAFSLLQGEVLMPSEANVTQSSPQLRGATRKIFPLRFHHIQAPLKNRRIYSSSANIL